MKFGTMAHIGPKPHRKWKFITVENAKKSLMITWLHTISANRCRKTARDSDINATEDKQKIILCPIDWHHTNTIRYDTIRDAILTCAQKLTWISSVILADLESLSPITRLLKWHFSRSCAVVGKISTGSVLARSLCVSWAPLSPLTRALLQLETKVCRKL